MKIKKSIVVLIVLIVWALFSVVYICWDRWQGFKATQIQQALNQGYQQGRQQIVMEIGQMGQNCEQAIPLNLGEDKDGKVITMNLINVACLKKDDSQTAPAAEEKK
jgi:hypothetical protein